MSLMLYKMALQRYEDKNLSGAQSTCRMIKKSSPFFAHSAFLLGCIAKDEKKWDLAITQFNKSRAVNPNNFLLHWNISDVYLRRGQYAEALKPCEQSLELANTVEEKAHCLRQRGKILLFLCQNDEALEALQQAIELTPDMAENHYLYGVIVLKNNDANDANDAIGAFEKAIELGMVTGPVYRDLGRAFIQVDRKAEAIAALEKSIELQGPDDSASHMIAALGNQQTTAPPDIYIEKLFDDFSAKFEQELVLELEYHVPTEIFELLEEQSLLQGGYANILDIGCGTGLVGQVLAPHSASISGVDLSQKMLDIAQEKGVYSHLSKNNIIDELQTIDMTAFDLITGADVMIYIGDMAPLFEILSRSNPMKKSARFVFSIELTTSHDYQLLTSGRYAQSAAYIKWLCNRYEFSIEVIKPTIIRTERNQDIEGAIYCIKRKKSSKP